jgi:hypothetical protein
MGLEKKRVQILPQDHRLDPHLITATLFILTKHIILVRTMSLQLDCVAPKVMPPIYFHGNYNRYKEHNNTI